MKRNWSTATALAFTLSFTHPAAAEFYCGAITSEKEVMPIILEISKDATKENHPSTMKAQYFYRKHKKVIPLTVVSTLGFKTELLEKNNGTAAKIILEGDVDECSSSLGCSIFTGFWESEKKKKMNLVVYEIRRSEKTITEYLNGIKPQKVSKGSTEVELVPDKIKNFDFHYRVNKYKSKKQIQAINEFLKPSESTEVKQNAEHACLDHFSTFTIKFDLITEDILFDGSINDLIIPGTSYNNLNLGSNTYYDLANRRILDVSNIFVDFEKNKVEVLKEIFASKIEELKKIPDDDCWYEFEETLSNDKNDYDIGYELYIDANKKQIGLSRMRPRVMDRCDKDPQWVQTSKIKKYLDPKTSLYAWLVSK
jgi:hypothetical protein